MKQTTSLPFLSSEDMAESEFNRLFQKKWWTFWERAAVKAKGNKKRQTWIQKLRDWNSLHTFWSRNGHVSGSNPSLCHRDYRPMAQWRLSQVYLKTCRAVLPQCGIKNGQSPHVQTHSRNRTSGLSAGPPSKNPSWQCQNKKKCWW